MRLMLLGSGLLALAALGSWLASPMPLVSLPWTLALLMGAGLVALAASGELAARADRVNLAILTLGAVFLLVSLVSTRWPEFKLPWFQPIYDPLSSLQHSLWGSQAGSFNPNQTGGVAAVIFALAASAFLLPAKEGPAWSWRHAGPAGLALLALLLVVLTGSRAALAGAGAALLLILVLRNRRWLWLLAGAMVLGLAFVAVKGDLLTQLAAVFLRDETLDTKLVARLDIWLSALRGIEDHAVTGIGMGVFNEIVPVRYPYESVGLSYSVSQAHNVLLDTALTLGLPGLAGLLLLLTGLVQQARSSLASEKRRALAGGTLAACLVYLVFGATDALSFSSPFGLVLWVLALALALPHRAAEASS